VKRRDQPRMRDESTAPSTDASNTASPGLDAAEPLTPAEQVVVSGVRAADSAHEDSGPGRNHGAAKCEYEPIQRPLPPPSLTTCDVASASSRSSTDGSSTPRQGHSLSRLLTTTLSLRATSRSGKRCIPSLWSSASRRSPRADWVNKGITTLGLFKHTLAGAGDEHLGAERLGPNECRPGPIAGSIRPFCLVIRSDKRTTLRESPWVAVWSQQGCPCGSPTTGTP
jgi:hypothetical protein